METAIDREGTGATDRHTFLVSAAAGYALWGVLIFYRSLPHNVVFSQIVVSIMIASALGGWLGRSKRWSALPWDWPAALCVGVVAAGLGPNFNVLFFYLLAPIYYPYPPPNHPELRVAAIVAVVVAFCLIHISLAARAADHLGRSRRPARDFGIGLLGYGLGLGAVLTTVCRYWTVALFVGLVCLAYASTRTWRSRIAALLLVGVGAALYIGQKELVYVGSVQEPRYLSRVDSPYARTYYYAYDDDNCVTQASNFHSITYTCLDPGRLPRGLLVLFDAIVGQKDSYKAMVLGRTLGMYPNILLAVNPNAEVIQVADWDRSIEKEVFKQSFQMTTPPEFRDKFRSFAGDMTRFLLNTHEHYDVVFYNGVGLSQAAMPLGLPYHEQYLYTPRAIHHLFYEVLGPDGVAVFDWGGRTMQDQTLMTSSLDPEISVRVYWYVLTEPPFTGTPLFYVVASRSRERMEAIDAHVRRASYFLPVAVKASHPVIPTWAFVREHGIGALLSDIRRLGDSTEPTEVRPTWDRPFMKFPVGAAQLALTSFMLLIWTLVVLVASLVVARARQGPVGPDERLPIHPVGLMILIALTLLAVMLVRIGNLIPLVVLVYFPAAIVDIYWFSRPARAWWKSAARLWRARPHLVILSPGRRDFLPHVAGVVAAMGVADTAARQSHQLFGEGYTWAWMAPVFFSTAAIALLVFGRMKPNLLTRALWSVVAVAGAWTANSDLTGWLCPIPVILVGASVGFLASLAFGRDRRDPDRNETGANLDDSAAADMGAWLGGVAGGYLGFLYGSFIVGYSPVAWIAAASSIWVIWSGVRGRGHRLVELG